MKQRWDPTWLLCLCGNNSLVSVRTQGSRGWHVRGAQNHSNTVMHFGQCSFPTVWKIHCVICDIWDKMHLDKGNVHICILRAKITSTAFFLEYMSWWSWPQEGVKKIWVASSGLYVNRRWRVKCGFSSKGQAILNALQISNITLLWLFRLALCISTWHLMFPICQDFFVIQCKDTSRKEMHWGRKSTSFYKMGLY